MEVFPLGAGAVDQLSTAVIFQSFVGCLRRGLWLMVDHQAAPTNTRKMTRAPVDHHQRREQERFPGTINHRLVDCQVINHMFLEIAFLGSKILSPLGGWSGGGVRHVALKARES